MDRIRVPGLTRLETLDFKKRFPDVDIQFEPPKTTVDAQHGELATAALIGVTLVGLQVLAAWLLKDNEKKKVEKTLEIVSPDGTRRTEKLAFEFTKSTSEADVIKELAKITNFDLNNLLQS